MEIEQLVHTLEVALTPDPDGHYVAQILLICNEFKVDGIATFVKKFTF